MRLDCRSTHEEGMKPAAEECAERRRHDARQTKTAEVCTSIAEVCKRKGGPAQQKYAPRSNPRGKRGFRFSRSMHLTAEVCVRKEAVISEKNLETRTTPPPILSLLPSFAVCGILHLHICRWVYVIPALLVSGLLLLSFDVHGPLNHPACFLKPLSFPVAVMGRLQIGLL